MTETIGDLQKRYARLLQRLLPRVPSSGFHLQIQTRPTHNGDAHVEVVDGVFHHVVTERGAELRRRAASDSDELLYWLIDDAITTLNATCGSSLLSRLLRRDPRRERFRDHLRLLDQVSPAWAARKKIEYDEVLARYPYRDKA